MFGPPSGPTVAGYQSIVVALVFFGIGYLIVNAVLGRRQVDPIIRVGLVLPALMGASLLLMLVHIVTGGQLYSHPGIVRAITVLGAIGLAFSTFVRRRRFSGPFPTSAGLALLGAVVVALFLWGRSVFEVLPAGMGDTAFHMGWAASLLNGERLPPGVITGEIPNYYPWLFHSFIAWLTALTPGGRPFHALGPGQLLQVGGAVASLFAVGYVLWRRWAAGLSVALLGGLTGGFGWLAENPHLIHFVRGRRSELSSTFGDLAARRSYNLSWHSLAPLYPREVTYALAPTLLILFALALRTGQRLYLIAAGFVLGFIGLIGGEAFFAGIALSAAFVLMSGKGGRIRAAAAIGIPAVGLYTLWLGPLMFNFFKYGGFDSLASAPVVLTPLQVLGAWGIVTPLALLGGALLTARVRSNPIDRIPLLYLISTGALLLVVMASASLLEEGFETLGRAHRYWPLFFQAAAISGGFGLLWILQSVTRLHRVAAIAVFVAATAFAFATPWIATRQLKDSLLETKLSNPALRDALRGSDNSWLSVMAPVPGQRCTVAVPQQLSVISHSYTGYRHVLYVWVKPKRNSARVRWQDIYTHIPTDAERRLANEVLTSPHGVHPRHYQRIVQRFGVDRVLVPEGALDSAALDQYEIHEGYGGPDRFGVVHTGDCTSA